MHLKTKPVYNKRTAKQKTPQQVAEFSLSPNFFQSLVIGLFHFLVISVPLFFTFNTSELFEFNKMVLTYGITALIMTTWFSRMILARKFLFRKTVLDIPILLFVVSQLLSVVFSIHPYTSLLGYYSRFHGGFLSVITYVLLYYAFVSNVEKKHLPAFFFSLTFSGVLVSFYAFLEHFGHSISCLMVDGEFGVSCWKQDVKNRVFATFGQPNWLAAYLIMLLPLTTALSVRKYKYWFLSVFYILATVLFFVVLIFTQSRSGFLGAVAGMGVFASLTAWKLFSQKKISEFIMDHNRALLSLSVGIITAAAIFGTPYTPSLSSVLNSAPEQIIPEASPAPVVNRLDVGGTDSGEIRKIVWQGAVKVWQRYPIFGSGLETFAYSYYQDRPVEHNHVSEWDFLYNKAHNEFLNFLATTGIVGLGSYLVLLGWFSYFSLKQLGNQKESDLNAALLLTASIGSLAAVSVSNFFGFSTVMVGVLMHLMFAWVLVTTAKNNKEIPAPTPPTASSYMLLTVMALLTLFLLRLVYQYWRADVNYNTGKALMDAGYFEQGAEYLNRAISENTQEALFYDELATQYARYAVAYASDNQAAEAQALTTAALKISDATIKLNSRQLNYHKTRASVFITLAQINPEFLTSAKQVLADARHLAPTDPKLVYNLGIVEISLNEVDAGIEHLEEAVALRPNYESARWQLAVAYEQQEKYNASREQLLYILEHISPTNEKAQEKLASVSAKLSDK